MTLDEYLAFEEQSPIKHEYVSGEVYAMSGVTTRHNLITRKGRTGRNTGMRTPRMYDHPFTTATGVSFATFLPIPAASTTSTTFATSL